MNQLRFIRNVIYRLKRDYGSTADVYYDETDSVDLETGKRTVSVEKITVRKAIPLPRKVQENPLLSAAILELFRRGGAVEFGDRELMFDYRDLPTAFNFSRVEYVIFQNIRYEILSFSDYETHAVVATLKSTAGAYRAAVVGESIQTTIHATTTIGETTL